MHYGGTRCTLPRSGLYGPSQVLCQLPWVLIGIMRYSKRDRFHSTCRLSTVSASPGVPYHASQWLSLSEQGTSRAVDTA